MAYLQEEESLGDLLDKFFGHVLRKELYQEFELQWRLLADILLQNLITYQAE